MQMYKFFSGAAIFAVVLLWGIMSPPAMAQVSALKKHDVKQPIHISADRLDVKQKENMAVFEGQVEAVQKNLTLQADRGAVFYRGNRKSAKQGDAPSIMRLDASGHVKLSSPTEKIESSWGVYDMEEQIVTLGGNVVMIHKDGTLKGERLVLNLRTGLTRMEGARQQGTTGRVTGEFRIPEQNGQ